MDAVEVLPSKGSSVLAIVAVAVGVGMGCGGGLLLAVLALIGQTAWSAR